jgi:hypothetical protein
MTVKNSADLVTKDQSGPAFKKDAWIYIGHDEYISDE